MAVSAFDNSRTLMPSDEAEFGVSVNCVFKIALFLSLGTFC